MQGLKVLAFAVASGKAGFVCLSEETLCHWGIAIAPTKNPQQLAQFAQAQIEDQSPDVVVTETISTDCRKGPRTKGLIEAVAHQASCNEVLDVSVPRMQRYQTKYHEARALVTGYPELTGYLPKRIPRFYEPEPRNMILFEALALAEAVKYGPQR